MIPDRSDPRWKALVLGDTRYPLKGLAAKMMLTRARLKSSRHDAKSLQDAIDTAYEYFSKNAEGAREDIEILFGGVKP